SAIKPVQGSQIPKNNNYVVNFPSALRVSLVLLNPNSKIPGLFRQIRANNFLQDLSHFTRVQELQLFPQPACKRGSTFDRRILEWPSQSPDLNPNENMWQNLKNKDQITSPCDLVRM
ncbi:hypothetical protein AMECASPLE_017951, partial [Ameca splendens]